MMKKEANEIALSAKNIYKDFYLPHEKSNSLKSHIIHMFQKKDKEVDVQHALRGISFNIKKGEFFGILGRNGSGKSTLLKILAEIYQPTKGSVHTSGKLVPFIELGVGFNPELTGRENVYLNGALLGFSRNEIDEKYDDIVKFAELEEFMDQKLKNYSSGMQVRLAFSVATRAKADILLVDEVLAVGDADFQRKCYNYFKSLKKQETTIVFVTHSMGAVREYCDRAILIEGGVITHQGTGISMANEYLKLFNNQPRVERGALKSQNRWGNGQVSFTQVNADISSSVVKISIGIKSQHMAQTIVFGLRMSDAAGKVLAGTSTEIMKKKVTLEEGVEKIIKITFPNIFGERRISIGGTIRLEGESTICDNWDDIIILNNPREETPYPVTLRKGVGMDVSIDISDRGLEV